MVLFVLASRYCRGMIKRVISQSGTGLAPWSINRQPMKLIERLARDSNCPRMNETEMFQCIYKLLQESNGDFYRLHLSLSIGKCESFLQISILRLADDNPYPVIDNDFLNDTIENLFQSEHYRQIDFLTGVTLNEGLYFAEYHIGHFYSDFNQQFTPIGKRPSYRQRRYMPHDTAGIIPPDLILTGDEEKDEQNQEEFRPPDQPTHVEQVFVYDPNVALKQFSKLNYVQRYIEANFYHGDCFMDEIRNRYEYPGKVPSEKRSHP